MLDFPLISLMLLVLPLGAILIWIMPANGVRWLALVTSLLSLLFSLAIVFNFDTSNPGFQFKESMNWIPSLNIFYKVGVDGISVLFLPASSLLFCAIILLSWNNTRHLTRLYYSLILLLQASTLGIFSALDTILFFFYWELTLIPIYFLISLWGIGPHRRYAAVKYTLFMLAGGIPLLFGFIVLAFNHAEFSNAVIPTGLSFDYETLLKTKISLDTQIVVFFLLLFGFAVKTPIFPFHTWLPTIAMEGPIGITAFLLGLKLGAFGLIRFVIPLAADAAQLFHWLLAGLGIIGMVYGALAALAQTNLRRMLAFASISHVGLIVLGIASFNIQGIQGSVFQLLNFTIVSSGMFLLAGALQQRTGSTDLVNLGGVAGKMPLLASFFFLFAIASMGIPGTNGFIAELLLLISVLNTHTGAGLAALVGVVLSAAYLVNFYKKAFLGPVKNAIITECQDLKPRELSIFLLFAIIILVTGFYPQLILEVITSSTEQWLSGIKTP
ncbi:NADH-ubiquinone oxidoreductase chain M [hydrothermal vent metagenome]|uniref:NADH-ubiquinone oxidoreductase chain M n=1 Tax=hydrothermal vent metagenome TaxID=652676 RepID=A0A3B0YEY8_9ZZZZ